MDIPNAMRYCEIFRIILAESGKTDEEWAVLLGNLTTGYINNVKNCHKTGSINLIVKAMEKAGIDPEACIELPSQRRKREGVIKKAEEILSSEDTYSERLREYIEDVSIRAERTRQETQPKIRKKKTREVAGQKAVS